MADEQQSYLSADLSEQVAVVTGASKGLGRAIAETLAQNGAKVACIARSADKLAETVEAIRAAGGEAEAFPCDVSQSANVDAVLDQVVEKWERIDIVVNNAGITRDTLLLRMSDEQWDEVIATNLKGVFLFTRAAAKVMLSSRYGRIINMTSIAGLRGNAGQANYSASKAALIGFTQTVARELAGRKITVNCVAPGMIKSDMTDVLPPAMLDEVVKKRIPAKRIGLPEDVSAAVLFLASKASSYITGQVLTVDGGFSSSLT